MSFKCDGTPYDSVKEAMEEHGEAEGMRRYLEDECGAIIEAPGKTGMAHAGMVSSEVWCDECGKHYTGAEARTKERHQNREEA